VAASLLVIAGAASLRLAAQPAGPSHAMPEPGPMPGVNEDKSRDYPGLHNAVAYHEGFVSGSAPEGSEGFDTIRAMGFRTIISVDGAEPDVAQAEARGIRYIHLPIGYNGFDEERRFQLVRATRDAMKDGPVYIHCHHGKHRSAAAAAAIAVALGWDSPDEAVARMKVSGTAPSYKGLYSCASGATAIDPALIDAVPAHFPSVWKPSDYVQGMVEIDEVMDRLKAIEKASWSAPSDHPDLVPVAEAGRFADLFRVLGDSAYAKAKPEEFGALMAEAHGEVQTLEDLLAAGHKDATALSAQLALVAASCKDCHARYRD
jgi:protein tyrosine phosphatase (PTP) superfamily phosphohydrolase (DUF442 family)